MSSPKLCGSTAIFCTMAEARDFKFSRQLGFGFAKAHHKTTLRGKVGVALG